jgi:hypothetical protein
MAPLPPKKKPSIPTAKAPPTKTRPVKTFSLTPWTGKGQGEKIILYGGSGTGKTTLCSMLPNAVFIGLDDGGRKIRNPKTGEPITCVDGVETFYDLRDALAQDDLWRAGTSCVIDTLTVVENLAEQWMFDTIPHQDHGTRVSNIEGYGYGKGYTHLFETIRLLLQDLDRLIRKGVHVCLVCQNMAIKRANPEGADYLYDGPKLCHPNSEKTSVRLHVCEWADHVLRIGHTGVNLIGKATDRVQKAKGTLDRAIYAAPEPHFFAKSRTLTEPVISFESPADDSVWQFVFPEGDA